MINSSSRRMDIFIEGNIGVGKSTLIARLADQYSFGVVQEPLLEWQNVNGHNLFALFSENPKKWAFAFQVQVLASFNKYDNLTTDNCVRVFERSRHAGMKIFSENLLKENVLSEVE